MLLLITGAGDELQGIKKGVIEIADALVINKADGDNIAETKAARSQFNRALHFVAPSTIGWQTRALTASGLTGDGIEAIWQMVLDFEAKTKANGGFEQRRSVQRKEWLHFALEAQLKDYVYGHQAIQAVLPQIEAAVMAGELPAAAAAEKLLGLILPR